MKCAVHPEVDATGYCRNCGKALCAQCTRDVRGILYCEGCLAELVTRPQPGTGGGSPGLAAVLGLIPGLGAVYNGEYTKAAIHVAIFAAFVGVLSSGRGDPVEPVAGVLLGAFIVYMVIDAYRTAKARALGQAPPSPTVDLAKGKPVGPWILIGLGVLFLLETLGILSLNRIFDFWPVILIAVGALLLWKRARPGSS